MNLLIRSFLLLIVKQSTNCVQIMNISGKVITDGMNTTKFSFMCSTTGNFMGCSVEFLLDKTTTDNIRQVNDSCYHKRGICDANICGCSPNCKGFVWIFIPKTDMTNHIFGCGGKIENAVPDILYRADASLLFDGNEFHLIENSTHPIKDSTNGPSIKEQENKIDFVYVIVGVTVVIVIVSVAVAICIFRRKHHDNSKENTPISHEIDKFSTANSL
ncbi:unnamed protein product [Mytilus coruscus]|uniref:Uncharacterized protein n=1 Tax=Mytilus coruscus TaxID=42192 RepID=A0A6J8CM31_MYTCO|nr:unnamed protein product [Mytilus coruscus]